MPKSNTYTVKSGDSWTKIAGELYGGNQRMFEDLMRANKGISMLRPGQTLVIPKQRENPYVSQFGAAATGMATQFDAQGNALAPAFPGGVVAPGTNVMNPYGAYKARQNAAGGGFGGGAGGVTGVNPLVPKPAAPGAGGAGDNWKNGPQAPNIPPVARTPPNSNYIPTPGQVTQTTSPTSVPTTMPTPTTQNAQPWVTPPMSNYPQFGPATGISAPPSVAAGVSNLNAGAFPSPFKPQAPKVYGPPAPTTPTTTPPVTQTGTAVPLPSTTPGVTQGPMQENAWIKDRAVNTYNQLDAALNGQPGATLPTALHGTEIQNMSQYTGYSTQAIVNNLIGAGYTWDTATNSLILPGSQASQFGVPQTNTGGSGLPAFSAAPAGGGELPAYRPPTYDVNAGIVRGRRGQVLNPSRGGGQPYPQQPQPAPAPQYGQAINNANWRIG